MLARRQLFLETRLAWVSGLINNYIIANLGKFLNYITPKDKYCTGLSVYRALLCYLCHTNSIVFAIVFGTFWASCIEQIDFFDCLFLALCVFC